MRQFSPEETTVVVCKGDLGGRFVIAFGDIGGIELELPPGASFRLFGKAEIEVAETVGAAGLQSVT